MSKGKEEHSWSDNQKREKKYLYLDKYEKIQERTETRIKKSEKRIDGISTAVKLVFTIVAAIITYLIIKG